MRVEPITKKEFTDMCKLDDDNYFQNGCIFDDDDNLLAFCEIAEPQIGKYEYYRLVREDDGLAEVLPE